MMDFVVVLCCGEHASGQLIRAHRQFPQPISQNTNMMDVISSASDIGNRCHMAEPINGAHCPMCAQLPRPN